MVSFGYKWEEIKDIDNSKITDSFSDQFDYYFQIGSMLHELGHNHGLGAGEYYTLGYVIDNTRLIAAAFYQPTEVILMGRIGGRENS